MPQIFKPSDAPMRVVIFGSGSFTNGREILEYQRRVTEQTGKAPYEVVGIFTDTKVGAVKAAELSLRYGLPNPEVHFLGEILRSKGKEKHDPDEKKIYFTEVVRKLKTYQPDLIVLAGYMKIVTDPLLAEYDGRIINVHPADLRILNGSGERRYTGDFAVRDAILAGETEIRSSTHIVVAKVDGGQLLLVSEPVKVELPEGTTVEDLKKPENLELLKDVVKKNQDRLKAAGDWKILPLTIHWIGEGRFSIEDDAVSLDNEPIPNGFEVAANT